MGQSFDDIFGSGSKASGGGGGKYIKWENVGDTFALVVRGPIDPKYPQKVFGTQKDKYLVQVAKGDKYKPMAEGDFNEDEVENFFQATEVMIPVTVAAKAEGKAQVEDFEPFDVEWVLNKGDQHDKFKDALLEFDDAIDVGTVIQVKLLVQGSSGKPGKYAIKLKAGE
jgi:hypothetical protein